jgi:glucose-1-phosphatase
MQTVKNIIFDLGVVLINIDYQLTAEGFRKLGVENFERQYAYHGQKELFNRFERGLLSPEEFCEEIRRITSPGLSDAQVREAWNAMLLDFPPERVELLRRLRSRYRLFLLSNTNSIHVEAFRASLLTQYGFDIFTELFEKAWFSNEMGMRKPERSIFEHVLNAHNLIPGETLFIDDVKANTDAALELGIQALLLPPGEDVLAVAARLNL